jgi:hypothetical protein
VAKNQEQNNAGVAGKEKKEGDTELDTKNELLSSTALVFMLHGNAWVGICCIFDPSCGLREGRETEK